MPRVESSWTYYFESALDWLYPRKCPLCGQLGNESPCQPCIDQFVVADPRVTNYSDGPLAYAAVLYRYKGRAGQAIRLLKYNRATCLSRYFSHAMASAIRDLGLDTDLVVPVPIHWSRRCLRGFNQSELIAKKMPTVPGALNRTRRTLPQAGLSREERERNLEGAFSATNVVKGKTVLLVDDVLTSGQTGRECARALMARGAIEVGILAFCGDV